MLIRSVPQRRVGVQVGQLWYCSVDCFVGAALTRLVELSDERIVEMPHRPRLPIGLVMVSKDYLTGEQLRYATAQSQLHNEELETALLRLGMASERQLAAARAAQWGCPLVKQDRIGQAVEADIPATLLRSSCAVPLHYSLEAKRLLLGFVYRVEHTLLHALEQVIGCKAQPCFVTPTEFDIQMARVTGVPNYEETVFEQLMTPMQMANTLGGLAVEISAREASFVNCRDYIWTRLSGRRRRVDVLFRAKRKIDTEKSEKFMYEEENFGSLG
ncbi:MAG: hypothetical protein ACLPY1_16340 [Terracidiphilus sp.]